MNLLLGHAALYQIKVADALSAGLLRSSMRPQAGHVGQMRCRNLNIALDNVTEAEVWRQCWPQPPCRRLPRG